MSETTMLLRLRAELRKGNASRQLDEQWEDLVRAGGYGLVPDWVKALPPPGNCRNCGAPPAGRPGCAYCGTGRTKGKLPTKPRGPENITVKG